MNRKLNWALQALSFYLLLSLLLILPVTAVEKGKAEKITTFSELEKAIEQEQQKVSANPKNVEGYYRLAELLGMEGRFNEAEQSLQKALNLKSDHFDSLIALSELYRRQYQFDKSEKAFAKAKAIGTKKIETNLLQARFAIDRMDFAAAESVYRDLIQKNPKSAEAIYGLAEVFYWRNQFKESEELIKQCLELDPEFSKAYLLQSLIHRLRQENDKWKETGQKAVDLAPFDEEARTNLAYILARGERKLEEGYEQTKIALRINPYSYTAHLYLGTGWTPKYYKEQKIEGDEQIKEKIKALLKEGDKALLNLEFSRADAAFSKVLELGPANIKAMIGRGTLNYHQKKYEDALSWFFKALGNDPDYGLAHYGVSQSLLRIKDRINVKLAEIEKEFALKDAPEPPYIRDVFINYEKLDPELQKILRLSVRPLSNYLKALKIAGATFYMIPFHKLLWESPSLGGMKGTRTFDLRLWDDVKGCGGGTSSSGADWEKDVKYRRYNVVSHEFTHQVHSFLTRKLRNEIRRLFLKAKKGRRTLDFYADFNEFEYFAVGVEAYVSEEKLADQKLGYGHVRKELLERDPDLYHFIESLSEKKKAIDCEVQAVARKVIGYVIGEGAEGKALKIYEEASAEYGRRPELMDALASSYLARKEYAKAKEIREQLMKEFPDEVSGYVGLANDYFYIDRDEAKAVRLLEESAKKFPNAAEIFWKLGEISYFAGDIDRMEKSLRYALSLDPNPDFYLSETYYFYLAKGLIEKEDYTEAEKLLNLRLKELDADNPLLRAELALVLLQTGREKEGEEHLNQALESARWFPRPSEVKALYLIRQGKTKEARDMLEKAVKNFPEEIEAKVDLARLIMETEPDNARKLLDEGLKIAASKEPADRTLKMRFMEGRISESRLHTAYGELLERAGESAKAIEHHQKAWDLFKYNYDSAVSLVGLYKKTHRDEDAKKAYEKLKSINPPEKYLKKCEELLKEEKAKLVRFVQYELSI